MNNLVWFRNNLRVEDNQSLLEATKKEGKIIGVYCFDPRHFSITPLGFKKTEKYRARFLWETILELQANLAQKNISLLVYHDTPENILPQVVDYYQINNLFTQKEWTEEEVSINYTLYKNPKMSHVNWHEYFDQFLFAPHDIPYPSFEKIPEVFTEFRKKCERESKIKSCVTIPVQPYENRLETTPPLPSLYDLGFELFDTHPNTAFPFHGGETQALKRIESYFFETENLSQYKQTRNGLIGTEYSSKFSAWLANGSLSARTIYWNVKEYEKAICKNEDTYWLIFELIWRDYFKYISLKHGNAIFKQDGILQKNYVWNQNKRAFEKWQQGTTGDSFIDANMKELLHTGWMSNRGRQNVASFWAKEWEQDWRWGAAYFESMLIDYDVHSNYGNWMYNSGVGNDPRDRKFNSKRQAEMYDPNRSFQQLWL